MKFKAVTPHAAAVLIGVTAGLSLSGCAGTGIKRLSGAEFVSRARQIEQVSSFSWLTYIGNSGQRAYLESGHPAFVGAGTRTTVFWTPLSDLPDELAQQLKAGTPPWTPWASTTNKTEAVIDVALPR